MCALCKLEEKQGCCLLSFVSPSLCGVYLYLLGSFEIMWPLLWALFWVMLACGSPQCRWLTAARQEGRKEKKKISLSQSHRGLTRRCARIHAAAFDKSVVTAKFKYNHCEQMLSPDNRTFSARCCCRETNMTFLGRLNISMLSECWYGSAGHAIELAHRRDIVRALMVLIDTHTCTHSYIAFFPLPRGLD